MNIRSTEKSELSQSLNPARKGWGVPSKQTLNRFLAYLKDGYKYFLPKPFGLGEKPKAMKKGGRILAGSEK
jgi:hypothetical protein